jgi:putative hydrolase of the HAD superfamily
MAYRLVIFDMGGVVVDFEVDRFLHHVSQLVQRPFDEVQQAVYHEDLLLPLEVGRIKPEQYYAHLKESLALPWTYDQFVRAWNDTLRENPDVTPLVHQVHKHHRLTALTNTNALHSQHMRTTFASLAVFDDWIASCEVGLRKPDPEIYRLALERADVEAQETVYVDDRPELIEAGRRVGLTAIRFESSKQLEQDLSSINLI